MRIKYLKIICKNINKYIIDIIIYNNISIYKIGLGYTY